VIFVRLCVSRGGIEGGRPARQRCCGTGGGDCAASDASHSVRRSGDAPGGSRRERSKLMFGEALRISFQGSICILLQQGTSCGVIIGVERRRSKGVRVWGHLASQKYERLNVTGPPRHGLCADGGQHGVAHGQLGEGARRRTGGNAYARGLAGARHGQVAAGVGGPHGAPAAPGRGAGSPALRGADERRRPTRRAAEQSCPAAQRGAGRCAQRGSSCCA
jgi:hypothetical protein